MKKTSRNKQAITDVLKRAIAESGLTHLRLSQETGIARASLIRFMQNQTSLRLDKADKLANYFGLELVAKTKR